MGKAVDFKSSSSNKRGLPHGHIHPSCARYRSMVYGLCGVQYPLHGQEILYLLQNVPARAFRGDFDEQRRLSSFLLLKPP
ncbi:hypothetical protein BGZ70_002664, partial [Mortierella alpina]